MGKVSVINGTQKYRLIDGLSDALTIKGIFESWGQRNKMSAAEIEASMQEFNELYEQYQNIEQAHETEHGQ